MEFSLEEELREQILQGRDDGDSIGGPSRTTGDSEQPAGHKAPPYRDIGGE